MDDNHTLSHTTWNCKYHIVFAQDKNMKKIMNSRESLIQKGFPAIILLKI